MSSISADVTAHILPGAIPPCGVAAFLNLHSFFHGHHTVELRGFNGTLHAGKIRAYIVLALALNHQALTQKNARYKKVQEENERFAMRTYLNRIGCLLPVEVRPPFVAVQRQFVLRLNPPDEDRKEENERFAMRTYLNRIGFIGDEFKNCREHLYHPPEEDRNLEAPLPFDGGNGAVISSPEPQPPVSEFRYAHDLSGGAAVFHLFQIEVGTVGG